MPECRKLYRIQHQRCFGEHAAVLLQNRVVEAETAEQALRIALASNKAEIEVSSADSATAERKSPTASDFWTAVIDDAF
jgi:hypothetical protein